jgi:glucokinase
LEPTIAAVDIGGSKIAVAIVDDSGRVLARRECPTEPKKGPAPGLERIAHMLRQVAMETGSTIAGIGIGSTGPVDPIEGTIGKADTLPGWEGTNLIAWLSNAFHVSVALENDADAAALGEAAVGAGRGEPVFVYVTISTGIGAGVVLDGRLYRGTGGSHPEIGHHVIEASGPLCYCGARGCWEAMASGPAMAAWAASRGLANSDGSELSAAQICALAAQGDPGAREAVDRAGYYIGVGLGNVISSFCPGTIALGGGVMKSAGLFMEKVREVIRTNCTLVPYEKAKLVMAVLGADAGLVGAWRAWHHRFGQPGEQL